MANFLPVSATSADERLAIAEGLAQAIATLGVILLRVAAERPGAFETMEGQCIAIGEVIGGLRLVREDIKAIIEHETSAVSRRLAEIDRDVKARRGEME